MQQRKNTGKHSETKTTKIWEALETAIMMFERPKTVRALLLSQPY